MKEAALSLLVGYVGLKFALYSAWCYFGSKWCFSPKSVAQALGLGLIRLVIGVVLGFAIGRALGMSGHHDVTSFGSSLLLVYIGGLIPVRWFEWWIMESLASSNPRPPFFTLNRKSLTFRLVGIAVSFLADAPMWGLTVLAMGIC